MSLSETFMKPSAMFYRNLLAMEVEEVIRCHPIDGVVLMGGCDKTTPAPGHGRDVSVDLPAIYVPGGPMLQGQLARHDARQRHRRVEVLGRAARGRTSTTASGRASRTASPARPATA